MVKSTGVTVIITVWKRDGYLEEQIEALLGQTVPPEQIWILHYEQHIDVRPVIDKYRSSCPNLFLIESDLNLKYFGRFSVAGHVPTEYVWLLDDDVIPGRKWLEISCAKCVEFNSVICSTGRIIPRNDFVPEKGGAGDIERYFIGDCQNTWSMNYCPADTVVDFGCNSYFVRSEWIQDFWAIWPTTFLSGEDIHLSASLKIKRNLPTLIPAQSCADTSGNLKKEYSCDEHSSWLKPDFFEIRERVFRNMIENFGWKPILW